MTMQQGEAPEQPVVTHMAPTEENTTVQQHEPNIEPLPVPGRSMTLSFSRKIQPKQYESAECFGSTKLEIPEDYPIEQLATLVQDEFAKIRSAVYEQLGISFTWDEATRTIQEAFGAADATVVASQPAAAPNAFAGTSFQPAPVTPPQPAAGVQFAPATTASGNPGWDDFIQSQGSTWQDCRATKTGRQPDFKHVSAKNDKGYPVGLWINDKTPAAARQMLGI